MTLCFGVLVVALEILILSEDQVRVLHSVDESVEPGATGDGKIPGGSGASPPPGNVHIRRAPETRIRVALVSRAAVLVAGPEKRPLG